VAGPVVALVDDATAWVFVHQAPDRGLGPAMLWARRRGVEQMQLVLDDDAAAGVTARRARLVPRAVGVLRLVGRELVEAAAADREPFTQVAASHASFIPHIVAGGATPVVEHGVLRGEVAGLEVCSVVDDPAAGVPVLEVGIGAGDREAFAVVHGSLPPAEAVGVAVAAVAPHRVPGAAPHPFNRLAAERLLRQRVLERPDVVGAAVLEPAPPPVRRVSVSERVPCVAVGAGTVVVCSVGIDPDLVPFAVDARDALGPDDELVLAVPTRDAATVGATWRGLLPHGTRIVGIDR
jgi:hypothetical protein